MTTEQYDKAQDLKWGIDGLKSSIEHFSDKETTSIVVNNYRTNIKTPGIEMTDELRGIILDSLDEQLDKALAEFEQI